MGYLHNGFYDKKYIFHGITKLLNCLMAPPALPMCVVLVSMFPKNSHFIKVTW
jgi:hypothetical protein